MKILLKKEIYRFRKQYMRFTGKAINHRNVLKKRKKKKRKKANADADKLNPNGYEEEIMTLT